MCNIYLTEFNVKKIISGVKAFFKKSWSMNFNQPTLNGNVFISKKNCWEIIANGCISMQKNSISIFKGHGRLDCKKVF